MEILRDYLLQICFLLGMFTQSFLFLGKKILSKTFFWLFVVWIFTMLWLFCIGYLSDGGTSLLNRMLLFGGIFWTFMFGITFFRDWFPTINFSTIALVVITFWYGWSTLFGQHYFLIGSMLSLVIVICFQFGIKHIFQKWRTLLILLFFVLVLGIGILQTSFMEFYVLIEPYSPIPFTYPEMILGGMVFLYVGMHAAMIFLFWSLSWSSLFTFWSPEKKQSPHKKTYELSLTEFGEKYDHSPPKGVEIMFLLLFFLFLFWNQTTLYFTPVFVTITGMFGIPQIITLSSKISLNFMKK